MGQKIHPLGFRIGINKSYCSTWFAINKEYSTLLEEDFIIRKHIRESFTYASISTINIRRKVTQIEIGIKTARPGVVLGRFGTGIENLRNALNHILQNTRQIRLDVIEIAEPDKEVSLLSDFLVQQLEKRIAFRRAIRQTIQKAQKSKVDGIKIQVSGRLNGAEIARSEWVREGRVPLQTLRADIDYSYKIARTTYGVLGVKIWLFQGETIA